MPLSKTRNNAQGPKAPIKGHAAMPDGESAVPAERMLSEVWLHSCGDEMAPMIGFGRAARRTDKKQDGRSLIQDDGSSLVAPKEQGDVAWKQQTLSLYDSLTPKLLPFLRHLGLRKEEMDDVIQESFLRLAEHLKSGRNNDNLPSWIYRVARNLAMDIHRSNRRDHEEVEFKPQDEPVDPKANPEGEYLLKEQFKRLKAAMSQLTAQQYNSILLRTQGLRYREIGEMLGISEQRAIHLVKRGLQRLLM